MDWSRPLQALGVLGVVASVVPILYGFQRPLCPSLSSGGECAPNPFYLVPGLLVAVLGIGLVVLVERRRGADGPSEPGAG